MFNSISCGFTKLDATRCVIYTYLVLGDILQYYKIKSRLDYNRQIILLPINPLNS